MSNKFHRTSLVQTDQAASRYPGVWAWKHFHNWLEKKSTKRNEIYLSSERNRGKQKKRQTSIFKARFLPSLFFFSFLNVWLFQRFLIFVVLEHCTDIESKKTKLFVLSVYFVSEREILFSLLKLFISYSFKSIEIFPLFFLCVNVLVSFWLFYLHVSMLIWKFSLWFRHFQAVSVLTRQRHKTHTHKHTDTQKTRDIRFRLVRDENSEQLRNGNDLLSTRIQVKHIVLKSKLKRVDTSKRENSCKSKQFD